MTAAATVTPVPALLGAVARADIYGHLRTSTACA